METKNDSISETSTESWGARIKASFKSVALGAALFIGAFPLLWWNEGRSVALDRSLIEMGKTVVDANDGKVIPANDGRLVYVSGAAKTAEVLVDREFGIATNAISLIRTVRSYQWIEEKKTTSKNNTGGSKETTTEYSYHRGWSEPIIDSSKFKQQSGHENPRQMRYRSSKLKAQTVSVGDFILSETITARIKGEEPLPISRVPVLAAGAKVVDQSIYIGADPSSPAIGDSMVQFTVIYPGQNVSIIAKQTGTALGPYTMKNGGRTEIVSMGIIGAQKLIAQARDRNNTSTWIFRLVGFAVMAAGLGMIFSPIVALAQVLPILGALFGNGIAVFSFIVSFALSLITIAVAWIAHRPVIGIGLLAAALAAVITGIVLGSKRAQKTRSA